MKKFQVALVSWTTDKREFQLDGSERNFDSLSDTTEVGNSGIQISSAPILITNLKSQITVSQGKGIWITEIEFDEREQNRTVKQRRSSGKIETITRTARMRQLIQLKPVYVVTFCSLDMKGNVLHSFPHLLTFLSTKHRREAIQFTSGLLHGSSETIEVCSFTNFQVGRHQSHALW